jgi:uncharacterized protein YjiK
MRGASVVAASVLGVVGACAGQSRDAPTEEVSVAVAVEAASNPGGAILGRYDFSKRTAHYYMPGRLDEISGLAMTPDGRLFAHGDEKAAIHEIDPATGEVGKRFFLGNHTVRDDFEGIAIVGERFFLISSLGILYEFREGDDREEVAYTRFDTGLGGRCEVEGLDYLASQDVLLVPCKKATPDNGFVVVHRIPLDASRPRPGPLLIPRSQIDSLGGNPAFHPSAIAVDTLSGSLLLASGVEETLIEVSMEKGVVAFVHLSKKRHPQTEGLAFGPDGTLYLSDEKHGKDARLTLYAPVGAGGGS